MLTRLLLLVAVCVSLRAQTVTGYQVEWLFDRGATVQWSVASNPGSSTMHLEAGTTAGGIEQRTPDRTDSLNGLHWTTLHRAPAGANYYYELTYGSAVLTCTGACTNCDSGDASFFADTNLAGVNGGTGSGFHCGANGEPPYITHPAAGSSDPIEPDLDIEHPNELWDGVGETLTVIDGVACADMWTTYDAERSNGSASEALIIRVDIDPDPVCETAKQTLGVNNWKAVVFQPDTPFLITPGARAIWEHAAHGEHMLTIEELNPERNESFSTSQLIRGADNVIFDQVQFRRPVGAIEPLQCAVTEVNGGARTVTVDGPCLSGLTGNHVVTLYLPGLTEYPAMGLVSTFSSNVITFQNLGGSMTKDDDFTGTYAGSGGLVTWGSHVPIASVTAANPITITTTMDHGLPDPAAATVHQDHLFVGQINGCDAANGTHVYTRVDADTISIPVDGTSGCSPAASPLGFLRLGSSPRRPLYSAAGLNSSYLSHVLVKDGWYGQHHSGALLSFGLNGSTTASNVGVFDSSFIGGASAILLNPATGLPTSWYSPTVGLDYFRFDGCQKCQFVNIAASGGLKTAHFNAQPSGGRVEDILIRSVEIFAAKRHFSGETNFSPESLGLYEDDPRAVVELKGGSERVWIDGLWAKGAAVGDDYGSTGFAMFFAITANAEQEADSRYVRDLRITNSLIEDFGAMFDSAFQTAGPTYHHGVNARISLTNNMHISGALDIRIQPRNEASDTIVGDNGGYQGSFRIGGLHFNYSNNTHRWAEGLNADIVWVYGGDAIPGCTVESNIFIDHCRSQPISSIGGTPLSPIDGTTLQTRFNSVCPDGSFQNNLILPGVVTPSDIAGERASSADADNCDDEWASRWPTSGSFSGVTPGPSGSTFDARLEALWPSESLAPHATYAAHGVQSIDTLRRSIGKVVSTAEPLVTSSSIHFEWDANTTEGCIIRYSLDDFTATQDSQTAASGSFAQSLTLTGLTSGETYSAFIECRGGESLFYQITLP